MEIFTSYKEMQESQSERYNAFSNKYMFYAFSEDQLKEGLEQFNLGAIPKEQLGEYITNIGAGGFVLKEHTQELMDLLTLFSQEEKAAFDNDKEGSGFIKEAFLYELGNHEYCITGDLEETLEALGLTREDIATRPNIKNGMFEALKEYQADTSEDWYI